MTHKHTPAPWDINAYNLCEVIVIRDGAAPDGKTYIDGRHQERVAMVGTDNSATWTERRANARLIAAAPDLLAALQELISYQAVKQLREYDNYPVFAKVDAAIAKATGE